MTAKFGSFFERAETGEKRQNMISSSAQDPDFCNFCYPYLFYHTLTDGVGLVDRAFAEVCEHSLFTCRSRYIEKLTHRCAGCQYSMLCCYIGTQCLGVSLACAIGNLHTRVTYHCLLVSPELAVVSSQHQEV